MSDDNNFNDIINTNYDPHIYAPIESDEHSIEFEGFRLNPWKQKLYWILIFCSFGFLWLLARWIPSIYIKCNCTKSSIQKANRICAKGNYKELTPIYKENDKFMINNGSNRFFIWRYQMWRWYSFVEDLSYCGKYRPVVYPFDKPISNYCNRLTQEQEEKHLNNKNILYNIYGDNLISIPLPGPIQLLLGEVLHPFYLFQLFSVVLWYVEVYATYATAIVIISVIGAIIGVLQTRKNLINLKRLAEYECSVNIYDINTGNSREISSKLLVPGDIIELKEGLIMPCDAILLQGKTVVNESMLTGESVPVIKTPVDIDDNDIYEPSKSKHSKYTLYGGTEILQIKTIDNPNILGMVFQTGFSTTKGQLVRSILYPKPLKMKFYRDSFYFVAFLFILCNNLILSIHILLIFILYKACLGFLFMIFRFVELNVPWYEIIIRGLDLYTIAIPPALPIALTIGTVFAVSRLKKKNISCIAPSRVNLAGLIETFCFDKTGTLTEDGLDVKSIRPSSGNPAVFLEECQNLQQCPSDDLTKVLTCCHSLALLGDTLVGDSLEVKMFEETRWILDEVNHESIHAGSIFKIRVHEPESVLVERQMNDSNTSLKQYGILKQYDFASEYQRMSTLCCNIDNNNLFLCTKGAPEVIGEICIPTSLPVDYNEILDMYTGCGFRVLACAIRDLSDFPLENALQLSRDDAEKNLRFVGLLIMQNTLKPETTPALKLLNHAKITSIMVTGDNPLTACYVAVACKLVPKGKKIYLSTVIEGQGVLWQDISNANTSPVELFQLLYGGNFANVYGTLSIQKDSFEKIPKYNSNDNIELAVTGIAFERLLQSPQEFQCVLDHAHVYARMKPDQKQRLVESLEEKGLTVGMCGDGANDCGALKAADVGISLSEAEASIAAPFTSAIPNIKCVDILLKEGRCALVTSFQAFKYMASYSLIQFSSSMILYAIASLFSDLQFLWIDLFVVMPLAFVSEYTGPYKKLSKRKPVSSLMGWNVISSLLIQNFINLAFQILAFGLLYTQSWFVPLNINPDSDNSLSYEVTTVFLVANFQYIFSVLAFSVGKPFRLQFYSNYSYLVTIVILIVLNSVLLLFPPNFILSWFELEDLPTNFKLILFALVIVNSIAVLIAEQIHHYLFITKDICKDQYKKPKATILK